MNDNDKTYSREFKAKVVLEAVSGEEINPHEIAENHDVSVEQILAWAQEMNVTDSNLKKLTDKTGTADETWETVNLETRNSVFAAEVEFGATFDSLDIKKLTYWSLFGALFVGLLVLTVVVIFNFTTASTIQHVSEQSEFYDIRDLRQQEQETLTTFGVVDLEEGIYRAPIDSVISRMAQE